MFLEQSFFSSSSDQSELTLQVLGKDYLFQDFPSLNPMHSIRPLLSSASFHSALYLPGEALTTLMVSTWLTVLSGFKRFEGKTILTLLTVNAQFLVLGRGA